MPKISIYALTCPDTGEIRYIGRTQLKMRQRLSSHRSSARRRENKSPVQEWIYRLLLDGKQPGYVVLQTFPPEDVESADRAETEAILQNRGQSDALLNVLDGGGAHIRKQLPAEALAMLGKVSDGEIADSLGVCRETVTYHRNREDIPQAKVQRPGPPVRRGPDNHLWKEIPESVLERLGEVPDTELAREIGVSRGVIASRRRQFGIPPCPNSQMVRVRGTSHHNSKLTPEMVEEIRATHQRYSKEFGAAALAKKFDVHISTVLAVVKGKTWSS